MAVGGETGATTADPDSGIADRVQITAGQVSPIVDPGEATAAVDGAVTTCGSRRRAICGRRIANRTAVKTGRLIGNRIVASMPEEKSEVSIVPIRLPVNAAVKGATMPAPRRWIDPTASSGWNVRNDRNGPSARKGRNDRSGLRELDGTRSELVVDSGAAAAPGDLPGAVVLSDWRDAGYGERVME